MPPALKFDAVETRAAGHTILGPVDLELNSRGITVLLGPNGAGKSLFLSLAHGLIPPDRGTVLWNGKPAAQSRRNRGFVFQNPPVFRRSVAGNIALPLAARDYSAERKSALLKRALHDAALANVAKNPAATLSGGEQQRLALARALVTEPEVVFLDEPAASLDAEFTAALEDRLRQIAGSGTKIIMSTHNLAQAQRLADDILFFSGGRLVEQAQARDFFAAPKSRAAADFLKGRL